MLSESYLALDHVWELPDHLHVVSVSSGVPSSVAAHRVLQRYGHERVQLVFCDTRWEDEDNYRFLEDVSRWLKQRVVHLVDGRTPLQVAEDRKIVPNTRFAPCTDALKLRMMRKYVSGLTRLGIRVTLHIGMDSKDEKKGRCEAPRKNWGKMGVAVEYPLLWSPVEYYPNEVIESANIPIPRMYNMGYSHANCGGRCIKQGQGDWRRTLTHFPERYAEVEAWEATMNHDPKYAGHTIVRRESSGETTMVTLAELREETTKASPSGLRQLALFDDMASVCGVECGIGYVESEEEGDTA